MNIPKKPLLEFITNEDLFEKVSDVVKVIQKASKQAEIKLFRNSLDPFSAIFDAARQDITHSQWMEQEAARQIQKTMQNAVGKFHQEIIGCVEGWESLGTGKVIDNKSDSQKIIAEIKNKHNTTKGNHRIAIYDDLEFELNNEYSGYTAYYVEIIPKNRKRYNEEFTPSDNKTKQRRAANPKIRVIDGNSFYELVTGDPKALRELYEVLPIVVMNILGKSHASMIKDSAFLEIFNRTY